MPYIYLLKDEHKDYCLFKIGYAVNIENRMKQYSTHNPTTECIDTMEVVNAKTEKLYQNYITSLGYSFLFSKVSNGKTEWFKIDYNDPNYNRLSTLGFKSITLPKEEYTGCPNVKCHQNKPGNYDRYTSIYYSRRRSTPKTKEQISNDKLYNDFCLIKDKIPQEIIGHKHLLIRYDENNGGYQYTKTQLKFFREQVLLHFDEL